ncbi:hypothetical protein W97_02791 [Coniosporium apollinis CBS 100218]|uniref:Peptidase S8/S53 domain-containing protein n=1 Tax=Coniosporium apollinis (strain CBS 100218) TaxID=1168221 RepID=R7YNX7_CONA1|nr:uncharacterized protein W97_02791 [Coniosporium apollinis CBS 100218]EON63563.1 hypothetical protein W97_02791 [Coniosporium apollinis CBS 100218]
MGKRAVDAPRLPEGIGSREPQANSPGPTADHITWDPAEWDSMKYVSQPKNDENPLGVRLDKVPSYRYRHDSDGEGVVVYVIDSGADTSTERIKYFENELYDEAMKESFEIVIQELLDLKNVVLVTPAGNNDEGVEIKTPPAVLGPKFEELIVVVGVIGDAGADRYKGKFQTADYIKISGVATDSVCASEKGKGDNGGDYEKGVAGTSYAAATVSGLAAYFLGTGVEVKGFRKTLYDAAYPRISEGRKVLWNGVDYTKVPGAPGGPPKEQNQNPSPRPCEDKNDLESLEKCQFECDGTGGTCTLYSVPLGSLWAPRFRCECPKPPSPPASPPPPTNPPPPCKPQGFISQEKSHAGCGGDGRCTTHIPFSPGVGPTPWFCECSE